MEDKNLELIKKNVLLLRMIVDSLLMANPNRSIIIDSIEKTIASIDDSEIDKDWFISELSHLKTVHRLADG